MQSKNVSVDICLLHIYCTLSRRLFHRNHVIVYTVHVNTYMYTSFSINTTKVSVELCVQYYNVQNVHIGSSLYASISQFICCKQHMSFPWCSRREGRAGYHSEAQRDRIVLHSHWTLHLVQFQGKHPCTRT